LDKVLILWERRWLLVKVDLKIDLPLNKIAQPQPLGLSASYTAFANDGSESKMKERKAKEKTTCLSL